MYYIVVEPLSEHCFDDCLTLATHVVTGLLTMQINGTTCTYVELIDAIIIA